MPYMYSEMQNKLSKTRESPLEPMGQISSRCPIGPSLAKMAAMTPIQDGVQVQLRVMTSNDPVTRSVSPRRVSKRPRPRKVAYVLEHGVVLLCTGGIYRTCNLGFSLRTDLILDGGLKIVGS